MAVKIFCVILLVLIYSTGDFFSNLILFHIVYLITGLPIKDETSETTLRNIYSLYFLIFMIPCNCKLVCFCTKSFNKPLDNYIYKGRILIINLRILTFQSFLSSLQSHPFVGNSVCAWKKCSIDNYLFVNSWTLYDEYDLRTRLLSEV